MKQVGGALKQVGGGKLVISKSEYRHRQQKQWKENLQPANSTKLLYIMNAWRDGFRFLFKHQLKQDEIEINGRFLYRSCFQF